MLFQSIATGKDDTIARVQFWFEHPGEIAGLPTGWPEYDHGTGGFEPTDLWILAGRPGMGKTALATGIANQVAINECRDEHDVVAIVSTEMPADLIRRRLAAVHSGLNEYKLRIGEGSAADYRTFSKYVNTVSRLPVLISDKPGVWTESFDKLDPGTIGGSIRRLQLDGYNVKLLIVDHIGRIGDDPTSSPNYRVGKIARNLKNLAMETRVPVLALSQLNRAVESTEDKRPQLIHIRDSGEVEQEADGVMLLYRPDYYWRPGQAGHIREYAGKALVDVVKARSGPIGDFQLGFDHCTTRFYSLKGQ